MTGPDDLIEPARADAVAAALSVLTGKALFLRPEEMAEALAAAEPFIRAEQTARIVNAMRARHSPVINATADAIEHEFGRSQTIRP